MKLKAYVDGSYNPSTLYWGAGAIVLGEADFVLDEILDSDFDHCGSRQISGECFSTTNALEKIYRDYDLSSIDEIQIFYDYLGIEKWARSEWAARSDIALEYSKIVKRWITLLRFEKNVMVTFHKIKAHSNDYYNDRADLLAKRACGVSN